ncbi:hypothetical protein HQ865_21315 [Mucilaginibacter mali]|uniref:DUF2975 domain-containing protein n=1 Tax=Mucilaginibacter mali TaxID=2740462 RepID=A0A7D4TPY8_9SPHI|nr:hypothetical protein [Mucilaginibacter mali]QKJ32193.1 hypothetical protein HQ865_21315 [Mucilaginibacter mali]
MKTSNRIITLIWLIIALSALFSVFSLFKGIGQYNSQPLFFWLTMIKLVSTAILLVMGLYMRRVVLSYTAKQPWDEKNYLKMKRMGYLALVLVNAAFQAGYEQMWKVLTHSIVPVDGLYSFRRFYGILFTESPAMWVLALSIFLFAELIKAAHQVKAENESFI